MQNYELLFILPGTMSDDEVAPVIEKVKSAVINNSGTNWELEPMEKRRLAYPMKHIRYGYFYLAFFQAGPEAVVKTRAELRLLPELLRSLVSKFDPEKQKFHKIDFSQAPQQFIDGVRVMAEINTVSAVKEKSEQHVEVANQVITATAAEDKAVEKQEYVKTDENIKEEKVTPKRGKKPIDLAEIDKKLDEILNLDLSNV